MEEKQVDFRDDVWELLALDGSQMPVAIFNGPICTTTGLYRITDIDVDEAKALIAKHGYVSAVGHAASAEVLSHILGVDVAMNRIEYIQEVGQKVIALRLRVRPPEGKILTAEEMLQVGFSLQLLQRLE